METAITLVLLAVTVLAGTAVSERLRVPAPLLLVLVGALGSLLPFAPTIELSPDVVLLGLLPPLLYSAALQTSLVDFRANRGAILALSVGLVLATTAVVAVVVRQLVPDLSWPAAVAIGAVVAPPDAVAATAVARRIGLPRRVVTILEGESLFNDATALVALRTAIAATAGGVAVLDVALDFVVAAGGGALVGLLAFVVVSKVRRRVTDPLLDTAISLVTPFAAYICAEEIEASGVIAVVVAGLLLGHKAPLVQTARSRITEQMTWASIAFVLEGAVFLLIGLQASALVEEVRRSDIGVGRVVLVCLAVLATVVVVRVAWVFSTRALLGRTRRAAALPPRQALLVGWAGMRGVVTLAAAYVIPDDTPHREVVLMIAFSTVAGTLFAQGLTLPLLTRLLGVPPPDPASDALARATVLQQAGEAGFARLDELDPAELGPEEHGVAEMVRTRVEQRSFAAWERLGTRDGAQSPAALYARVRQEMLAAERERVLQIRSEGEMPSQVIREVLAMLDIEESMVEAARQDEPAPAPTADTVAAGASCDDLDAHPALDEATAQTCPACEAEGTTWVTLRRCLGCGEVGCCDSSPQRHASRHFEHTQHPVMQSAEPDESWRWCFVHQLSG
ncbi:Na+/H+ antiporter [Janibacter melonis]|uniref:Na+/H+ antiporter n=1 Tax=Janibacter melonis TaxID=262209 RepID=UPI00191B7BA1|nr:Na+/H+ antiporter [Janibacter melonis]